MMKNGNWEPLTSEEDEDRIEETVAFGGGYRKITRWRKNNQIARDEYFDEQGQLHRESGPARVSYFGCSGSPAHVDYFWHGLPHRIDGPAQQCWWSNGVLDEEAWYVDGMRHREGNKPALIRMDMSGKYAECEEYYIKGRLHRSDGPAAIERDCRCNISNKRYEIIESVKYYHHGLKQSDLADDPDLTPS